MAEHGYTISPVVTEDEHGREVVTDFSVASGRETLIGRDGRLTDWESDFYQDSNGEYHHHFSNVELESDKADQGVYFDESEYISALMEANPEFNAAQQWATNTLTEEELADYNRMVDNGDLDDLNQAVEWLLEQYNNRLEDIPESEEVEEEEEVEDFFYGDLTEDEREEVDTITSEIAEQEPLGSEVAEQWQHAAEEAEASGDTALALVATATAAVHQGQMTSEEAVSFCLENVPINDLLRVYKQHMQ